jgi:protein TonB
MVTTLPLGHLTFRMPEPRHVASWAIAFSVLLHIALGWYFVSRLMIEPVLRPDDPTTIVMEPMPAPEVKRDQPKIKADSLKKEPERPRRAIHIPDRVVPSSSVPALPIEPALPVEVPGPVSPEPADEVPAPAPKATRRVQPVYPVKAAELGKMGDVEVYVAVGAGGAVTDVQIVREDPKGYGFGRAAVAAVRRWEFATAAPGVYRVTVRFRLGE